LGDVRLTIEGGPPSPEENVRFGPILLQKSFEFFDEQ